MKRIALVVALLVAGAAIADRVLGTASSANASITHGDWRVLPDAGFAYTVCGNTTAGTARVYSFPNTDGGAEVGPCEICTPGSWASAPATCVAQWKANRGL